MIREILSYWKADVSTLVNIFFFFTAGIWMISYSIFCPSARRWWYDRNVKPNLSQMDPFHLRFNANSLLMPLYFPFLPRNKFALLFPNWSFEWKGIKKIKSYNSKRQNIQCKHSFAPGIFGKGNKTYANQGILTSTFI